MTACVCVRARGGVCVSSVEAGISSDCLTPYICRVGFVMTMAFVFIIMICYHLAPETAVVFLFLSLRIKMLHCVWKTCIKVVRPCSAVY